MTFKEAAKTNCAVAQEILGSKPKMAATELPREVVANLRAAKDKARDIFSRKPGSLMTLRNPSKCRRNREE